MPKPNAAKSFRDYFAIEKIKNVFDTKVYGPRAIGLDRVDSINFLSNSAREFSVISRKVLSGDYAFTKYKEKLISKGANKSPRQLSIPTIRDRLTLRVICDFLFLVFPEAKPALPQEKVDQLKQAILSGKYTHFIKIDLKEFYPSLSHRLLTKTLRSRIRLPEFHKLVVAALENPTVPENGVRGATKCEKGVPQGLSISNVLAEIFMISIDQQIHQVADTCIRFVDDILILTDKNPHKIYEEAYSILKKGKLNPHSIDAIGSKTQVGTIGSGFDFLGYSLSQSGTSIKRGSRNNFESSLIGVFTEYKHRFKSAKNQSEKEFALARFWWSLNLKLTGCIYKQQRFGWVFYYSQITDLAVLHQVDSTVVKLIERFQIPGPSRPKKLLKSFYESKRIDKESHLYIPNYDTLTVEKMRDLLKKIGYKVDDLPDTEISFSFHRTIRKATRNLEKDVASFS